MPAPHDHIQIIGSGNVAYHLARRFAFSAKCHKINIVARSNSQRSIFEALSDKVKFFGPEQFNPEIGTSIIAVSDDSIQDVAGKYSDYPHLMLHTAGSVNIDVLGNAGLNNFGSLYPLQTFSAGKEVSWSEIPVFIAANNEENLKLTSAWAHELSNRVHPISDAQRLSLHIAAVIANNFTNHLLAEADSWLKSHQLKFEFLLPLIHETIEKLKLMSPYDAQTGPAIRNDKRVIEKHLSQLDNWSNLKDIYQLLSQSIRKMHEK